MKNKKHMLYFVFVLTMAVSPFFAFAAKEPAKDKDGATNKAEKAPAKPKKKIRKNPEYRRWAEASAVADSWDQPVLIFFELEDLQDCGRLRMKTVTVPVFAELVKQNFVFMRYTVPRKVTKSRRDRNKPPVPDYEAIRKDERKIFGAIKNRMKKPSFPLIALVSPEGKVIATSLLDVETTTFSSFVDELGGYFKTGKYSFTIPPKVQRELDAEAKKRAALEKNKKK